jgi:hypothetical protein
MSVNPYPTGLRFGGAAAQRLERRLGKLAVENTRRVRCDQCDLMILPENMSRHLAIVHGDDE